MIINTHLPTENMFFVLDGQISIGIDFSNKEFQGRMIPEVADDLGIHKFEIAKHY